MSKNEDLIARYEDLDLKKLPEEIKRGGFVYKLLKRDCRKCLYGQYDKKGTAVAYELFLNKIVPYREAMKHFCDRSKVPYISENYSEYSEHFPSDEEFGKRAWCVSSLFDAQKRYEEL
jgi:hypothetical protein